MRMSGKSKGALAVATTLAVVAAALSVWASEPKVAGGADRFRPNRTAFRWTSNQQQTSSKEFRRIPGIGSFPIKHYGPLVAAVTVKVRGTAPAEFRLGDRKFEPRTATFDPSSSSRGQTFSFTAVLQNEGWTCTDADLLWRSPTGAALDLGSANVVVDYKVAKEGPDFACK